jgi:hypothetical protein
MKTSIVVLTAVLALGSMQASAAYMWLNISGESQNNLEVVGGGNRSVIAAPSGTCNADQCKWWY